MRSGCSVGVWKSAHHPVAERLHQAPVVFRQYRGDPRVERAGQIAGQRIAELAVQPRALGQIGECDRKLARVSHRFLAAT
jgi:hypothetical protein